MALLPKKKTDAGERFPALSLREEVNRLFDDFFSGGLLTFPARGEWAPALDVSESDTRVTVKAEVPGIDPKDIDVSVTADTLTIKGQKKEETESKDQNYYRMERRYGSFQRAVTLPAAVDPSKVTAECKNGVLFVAMDKKEHTKARNVQIKVT